MSRAPQPFDPADRGDERLVLDAEAVRAWSARTAEALGRERAAIDAINVFPVADGDTGTNLYLTADAGRRAVEAVFAAPGAAGASAPDTADAVRALAHGALLGARGNSGTILSQLLRGMAAVLADGGDGDHLARALDTAAASARAAVAHPEEGTILTVASAAAAGCAAGGTLPEVARKAYDGARTALEATPGQLAVLGRAGVVDAGGQGLVAVLGALVETVTGRAPEPLPPSPAVRALPERPGETCGHDGAQGPGYEVLYLLEAEDAAVELLKARLDALGDSLVVVGGDGLWNVHVHVDDAGAAVEAGIEAGRPHRIRVTHFASAAPAPAPDAPDHTAEAPAHARGERAQRAVVAVLPGEGLAGLCAEAGATTLQARPGEPPTGDELLDAVRRAHAREVVLLPNDTELRAAAASAAERARAEGIRVALIPTRAAVQGIAALAVHEPGRSFDEDVVAMTAAAGATRYAELAVAARQSFTSAGVCQAGDVLGLIEGDVAVIGQDLTATARTVLDRMLQAGGELVTLVVADSAPAGLADTLEAHVRRGYLAVDTVTYHAGEGAPPLLVGVE
ncbi:DAK2 domain-containing protein [Streptomyces sp. R302]|uniref:DAK2 domain-containing protein n=1 Tax=unclassified Streptomyces TaxID=2593676 RepID=UPI00145F2FD3|nr:MULTISPECIES: DAK2 domain-containing protein [unclassified Streptomyces]NML53311.1 DAK2 domain-containing protein [Streptomyces sp. R301]NML78265.1 DAK2 domain-containing protein [Streptomyces sp. R302]